MRLVKALLDKAIKILNLKNDFFYKLNNVDTY